MIMWLRFANFYTVNNVYSIQEAGTANIYKTLQELRMLSSVPLNCQVTKIVRIVINVSKLQVFRIIIAIVKIIQNCKNCQNCQTNEKSQSVKIVKKCQAVKKFKIVKQILIAKGVTKCQSCKNCIIVIIIRKVPTSLGRPFFQVKYNILPPRVLSARLGCNRLQMTRVKCSGCSRLPCSCTSRLPCSCTPSQTSRRPYTWSGPRGERASDSARR